MFLRLNYFHKNNTNIMFGFIAVSVVIKLDVRPNEIKIILKAL